MNKKDLGILILLAVVLVLVRWPFLEVPLERDEGEYAYCAWQMQQGNMPYRDIMTFVSPGIFFLYSFCFAIIGETVKDIRLFTMLFLVITLAVFYYLSRRLLGIAAAIAASLAFIFLIVDPGLLACMSNRETFMLLPILLSFLCLELGLSTGRRRWFVIVGLLNALAFMLKQTAIFNILFTLAVYGWHYYQKKEYRLFWQSLGFSVVGFACGLSLFVFYFYSHQALWDFYYWVFVHPRVMSAQLRWGGGKNFAELWWLIKNISIDTLIPVIKKQFVLILLAVSGVIVIIYQKQKKYYYLVLWLFFMLFGVTTGWRLRRHYLQLLTVPTALLCGCLAVYGQEWLKARWPGKFKIIYFSGLYAMLCIPFFPLVWQYGPLTPEEISKKLYGTQVFSAADTISQYVTRQTAPDDPLYILGSEQEIYFYSKRKCANEHITAYTLTYNFGDPRSRQKAVASSLWRQLPPVMIKINQSVSLYDMPAVTPENLIFTEFFNLVQRSYTLDGVVYIKTDRNIFIFGHKKIQEITGPSANLAEELKKLESRLRSTPDVLIFKKNPETGH
ncbi:MAG: glycosyltransferase family 39 protein [bacterium]|nr:glycosyltransferase family 39 protein [bacterium]